MNIEDSKTYREDLAIAVNDIQNIEMLRNQSVLIAGASGLIGSFIADTLMMANEMKNLNIKVYAAGRNLERLQNRFSSYLSKSSFECIEHDVNKDVDFDVQADYIIHAASNAFPAVFASDPVGTIMSNVLGTYRLLEYLKKCGGKRLLYVSSGEVYGQGDVTLEAFEEDFSGYVDPTQTRSCYPSSKRTAETLCVSYAKQFDIEALIVRPCHTYGPNATSYDNRANVQFVNNVMNGEDIILKSAGSQMRSYCYVADNASGILTVLTSGNSGEAYNIANKDARVTVAGFAEVVAKAAGRKVVFENPDKVAIEQQTPIQKAVLASDKLESLGWKGHFSVENGVRHLLNILSEINS